MNTEMSKFKSPCSKCSKPSLMDICVSCLNKDNKESKKKVIKKSKKPIFNITKEPKKNAEIKTDITEKKSNPIINNMLKVDSDNHILEFTEKINVVRALKLINMKNKDIIDKVYDKDEVDENGKTYTADETDEYIKLIKDYLRLAISNGGIINRKYKYSKPLKESKVGRIYVEGFGIQYLQKKLRGYLGGEYTIDIDMKNCFPSLMVWLVENHYSNIDITNLKKYVKKRETLLERYKTDKVEILKWSNRDFAYTGGNVLIKCLDKEFKSIQRALWNDKESSVVKMVNRDLITSTNKKGSLLNRVLGIIENDILQQVAIKHREKISVPYYDGSWFNIEKVEDETKLIQELNEFTKSYGVEWCNKEHDTLELEDEGVNDDDELVIDEDEEVKLYGYEFISYPDLKEKFEKNHSVIADPLMVVREYYDYYSYDNLKRKSKKYALYSFANLNDLYKNLYYYIKEQKNIGTKKKPEWIETVIKVPFVKDWLIDETRKTLSKMDFVPSNPNKKLAPNSIYNMFHGYTAKLPKEDKEYDFDVENEVKRFIDHLSLLVGHEEEAHHYLINYIADLIQNPYRLPAVALVFKSKQGLGKDLMINYIEKIVGESLVYRTENMEEIYGNFNPAVKGKLVVQLNELEGKDGFAKKEKLKGSISAEHLNINEKNVKQFKIHNSIRFFIFSNNLTPIEIPVDDRRFVVYEGADLLPEKERDDYYNPLFDNLDNQEIIDKLLEYFMNIDLSDFNLKRQRPITKAYKDIRENCIPAIYKFSWDLFNDLFEPDSLAVKMKLHKKINKHLIKSTDFHKLYTDWYNKVLKAETTLNFKNIKPMLEDINIKKKEVRINGFKDYYYIVDKEEVIKKLRDDKKCGVEDDDVLELDDDFEDDDNFMLDDDDY